ncbi:hypothetical protein Acr_11g0017600 [Actinidia rufa]|uniref:NAC domain-containing protein n=1 Tax=Actinidia rufa TaxID=165716 RepID=A0A7J0FFI0_9ERIC|nr:hypothetical protein Acr_11g0017600 [Actinidia rufa]
MAKSIPDGFKFRPTNQQLIHDYLFNKIVGKELPFEGIILERDVYDKQVLSQIFRSWDESGDSRSYFFTRLKKKAANYCRWKRHVESKDYVICMLQKSRGGKHGKVETMQSNRNGDEALTNMPSGLFNNKRIKLIAKQNQKMENDTFGNAPSGNEQVGLIHGEAGIETLEQIMRDLLAPEPSMENVENVETLEQIMRDLLAPEPSMENVENVETPEQIMRDLLAPEPSMENVENVVVADTPSCQVLHCTPVMLNLSPSIADQSLLLSNPEYAFFDCIHSLASAPEVTEAESDVRILDQPCMPAPESLSADSFGHAVLNSVISLATPAPTVEPSIVQDPFLNKYPEVTAAENDVEILEQPCIQVTATENDVGILEHTALTGEPSYEVGYNRIWVESFAEDLLSVQHDLPLEENDQEVGELLEFHNPTYDWLFR